MGMDKFSKVAFSIPLMKKFEFCEFYNIYEIYLFLLNVNNGKF